MDDHAGQQEGGARLTDTATPRSAAQVIDDHLRERRADGDFEADLARNFAPDVVMFIADGIFRGHDGVRALHRRLLAELPGARWEYRVRLVDGDVGFLEWSAQGPTARVDDGADSYVVRDGRIVAQTIHYSVTRS